MTVFGSIFRAWPSQLFPKSWGEGEYDKESGTDDGCFRSRGTDKSQQGSLGTGAGETGLARVLSPPQP